MEERQKDLTISYNVAAPRYTSYPTMPFWDKEVPDKKRWMDVVKYTFDASNATKGISLYIHLPFCEMPCINSNFDTHITNNHNAELDYIKAIHAEWQLYLNHLTEKPTIRELHLGGGMPTFFKPKKLKKLFDGIFAGSILHPQKEFSFEGDPNTTTTEQLQTLYKLGFSSVKFGVQDFDPKVQQAINRIQPFENVKHIIAEARRIGYKSTNIDLFYGLPNQTQQSASKTIDKVVELLPDRISFYPYDHVPWVKSGQRSFTEKGFTESAGKYDLGFQKLNAVGYTCIGTDHYVLPEDTHFKAYKNKVLYQNFIGYTSCDTDLLIGLGASSISDAKYGYLQNLKNVASYKSLVLSGELAVLKGHFLTDEDVFIKDAIQNITCKNELVIDKEMLWLLPNQVFNKLLQMEKDGLVKVSGDSLQVTTLGKAFTQNICMAFDIKQRDSEIREQQWCSKTE